MRARIRNISLVCQLQKFTSIKLSSTLHAAASTREKEADEIGIKVDNKQHVNRPTSTAVASGRTARRRFYRKSSDTGNEEDTSEHTDDNAYGS